jgi:PBSX family phage portal protein
MDDDERTEYIINIGSDDFEKVDEFRALDPFNKSWEDLKGLQGINTNFKRRTTRTEKAAGQTYQEMAGTLPVGQGGSGSKQINIGEVFRNGYGTFDVITPPYNLYELANFYDTNFANHAAIDAIVANVVGLGYGFETVKEVQLALEDHSNKSAADKAAKRIERLKNDMEIWLEGCNDDDSFTTVLEKVYTDFKATGNGYIEIGRTVTGAIGYIGHIPSTTMRVRRLKDGFVQIVGNRVVYFRNFQATNPNPMTNDPRPNEVIHIKDYSPLNTFYGVPDIISAMTSLIGDQMAAQYNVDYFENKAVPRYIIVVKGAKLSAESEDKLFRFLQTNLKNQNHRTLYVPLPVDQDGNKIEFEMHAIENQVQEGSFENYRKRNRDDILMAHQFPLSKLGSTDSGGLAAAMANDRTFKEQVARPAQNNLQKILNKVIKEKSDIVELKLNELTLTDETAQSQNLERFVKNQIMLPNEARAVIHLPPREGGDKPMELSPRQAADSKNQLAGSDKKSTERANNNSDSTSTTTGRNAKGEGRAAS